MHIELPFTDPVLIVALAMTIFLVVPLIFERFGVPGIIGIIVAGAAIGPYGAGVLARDQTIVLLGTVGLLYLMFLVGLELDLVDFNRYRNRSVTFGAISFLIPQLVGTGVGLAFGYGVGSSILLGAVFASHTVLAYPIASRLGILKNQAVLATLGGTILTEILALLVLAVVVGARGGGIGPVFWATLLGSLALYVGLILWGVPKLGRWFFRRVRSEGVTEFVFVMAVVFGVAYAAHAAHVEPIIGALLAGLALNRLVPESGTLMNRIHFVGDALFIPFFLLSVGMLVDVRALADPSALLFSVALAVGVVVSKWLASLTTQRIFGYTGDEGWVMLGLSVPHASGTLAIVLVGFGIGIFDQTEVNGVVLTILVTSLIGPWVVERYGRRIALQEEQRPYEPSEAPQRILIPISNPATSDALLDLALMMRSSDEPLLPLMVVRQNGDDTEAQVAEAEKMLGHAVIHAAAADVPVTPVTRIDRNVATGVVRAMAETRSNAMVVGWDGTRSGSRQIFGSVLDQLLEQTRQLVFVSKLGHPLNTTRRLVLICPAAARRHPGFWETMGAVKSLGARLGATLLGLVVAGDAVRWKTLAAEVTPPVPTDFETVPGWGELTDVLRERLTPDDLVVVLSARRGTLAWHPQLERLPRQLARLAPESFIIAYPAEREAAERRRLTSTAEASGISPARILKLEEQPFAAALEELIGGVVAEERVLAGLVGRLVASETDFSSEILPGVVLPHLRIDGIREPVLLLGICPDGIHFPKATQPARLIFVLISPSSRPEEHLKQLARIARFVASPEHVVELLEEHAPEAPTEWLSLEHA